MVTLRSQDGVAMEQRMSRMEEMMEGLQKAQSNISRQLSELMATMNRSRGDRRTETDWWYRSEKENPEDQAINDEELVVNEVEKVKKDLVASDVDGETEILIDQNQLIQEAKNHSTDSVHETSLLHHNNSLLKHQVSISHLEFSHRSPIECLDVYEELPSASIARQVFDPLPLKKKLLRNRRRTTFSKTWCFKFKELDVRQEDVLIVLLAFLHMNTIETRYATGKCDEMFEVARDVSKRSMLGLTFGIRESNAGQEQQAVCEQIIMVTVWLYQISLVLQQVMTSKKIKFPKRWMFKYKVDEEDQGILQSRTGWIQEVFAVIGYLLRHLQLTFNCEEPELAGRKRNHGLFIRLHSKQKQRKCPKSWMYKFKMDSEPAGTSYLKRHKEWGICAQIRLAKKQSKLLLLSLCPSFICRAMLRVTVKQRKHSKTWSFKYKQQGNFRLLRCVGERTRKDMVTVTSCRSYGLDKKFLLLNLEVKVSLRGKI